MLNYFRVEVSIKTRKPTSERKEKNWSSLMSESSPEFQEAKISRTRPPKKEPSQFRGFPAKKLNAGPEGRHFAQATKSSKAKKFSHEVIAKSDAKLRHDSKVRIKCFEQYLCRNNCLKLLILQRANFKTKAFAFT
jgi:hypothetical protein